MRAAAIVALALGACGGPPAALPPAPGGAFIAFARDFQRFRSWERVVHGDAGPRGITHLAGRRTEYINVRPPPGADRFPVGTMIVKEVLAPPPEGRHLFAMVKRGGGYNARGAPGWEWFELEERGGAVAIAWRGINAPAGERYGAGDPLGGCNGCHETSAKNDFVMAEALSLGAR